MALALGAIRAFHRDAGRGGRVRGLGRHLDRLDRPPGAVRPRARPRARGRLDQGGPGLEAGRGSGTRACGCTCARRPGCRCWWRRAPVIAATRGPQIGPLPAFPAAHQALGRLPAGLPGGQVQAEGFDEALLTRDDGVISEGAVTNLAVSTAAG